MIIESIQLKNFQGHLESNIELHPNVNAIVGESDAGKSSIIRFIKWLNTNRPTGDGYKNNKTAKSTEYGGKIIFSDTSIERRKSTKLNAYVINDVEELKAISTDIPREVSAALQLNDINIQSQHDSYFLLQESPGKVAKRLNELVNLDIIDHVLQQVNTTLRDTKRGVASVENSIGILEEKLTQFTHIPKAEKLIETLERDIKDQVITKNLIGELNYAVDKITSSEEEMEAVTEWLGIEKDLNIIISLINSRQESTTRVEELDTMVKELEEAEADIAECDVIVGCAHIADSIVEAAESYEVARKLKNDITVLVEHTSNSMSDLTVIEDNVREFVDDLAKILRIAKVCPICGKNMSAKDIEKHIGGLI